MTTTDLAQRLRAARTAISPAITQRDVAKQFNRSPSAINLWEKGKTEPSATDLAALARLYQVSADWLLSVETKAPGRQIRTSGDTAPLWTVPVLPPGSLMRWHWETVTELLQTSVAYPHQTAAAVLVNSDALAHTCPPGCYAVVSKAHHVEPGQIVMASVGRATEPVLRKLVREGGESLLIADDMRYPSYRLDDGVKIIGRVTEITIRRAVH